MDAVARKFKPEMSVAFGQLTERLAGESDGLPAETFREIITKIMEKNNIKPGQVMQIIRILITGTTTGIDLMKTLELIGPSEVAARLQAGIGQLDIK
jgi:glutamyl-tRNA synthetase